MPGSRTCREHGEGGGVGAVLGEHHPVGMRNLVDKHLGQLDHLWTRTVQ